MMKKTQFNFSVIALFLALSILFSCTTGENNKKEKTADQSSGEPDRTVLPIKDPTPPLYTELDVRNATPPPQVRGKSTQRGTQCFAGSY